MTRAALLPAGDLDLIAAQRDLRVSLLPDLVTWFGLHGGSGHTFECTILPACMALDLPSAVDESVMIRGIWEETREVFGVDLDSEEARTAGSVVWTWPDEYLMIGADGSGGGLFVDQRPGPLQGCVRWWDKVDADAHGGEGPEAASLLQLVTNLAAAVRNRTPIGYYIPVVVDGELDWDVVD